MFPFWPQVFTEQKKQNSPIDALPECDIVPLNTTRRFRMNVSRLLSLSFLVLFSIFLANSIGQSQCIPGVNCALTNVRDACENACQQYQYDCNLKPGGSPGDECDGVGRQCIERVWVGGMDHEYAICNYNHQAPPDWGCTIVGGLVTFTVNKLGNSSCTYDPGIDDCVALTPCGGYSAECNQPATSDCVAYLCSGSQACP